MRKLYTEWDLRRVSGEGVQSGSVSRLVPTTSASGPPPPAAATDTLAATAVTRPPNYGSFAHRHQRLHSTSADDDEPCPSPVVTMMSFDMPTTAVSPRWRWSQWRRWKAWLSLDAVTLAESIDRYSRIGFPFVFFVLSFVYWVVYLQIRPAGYEDDFVLVD